MRVVDVAFAAAVDGRANELHSSVNPVREMARPKSSIVVWQEGPEHAAIHEDHFFVVGAEAQAPERLVARESEARRLHVVASIHARYRPYFSTRRVVSAEAVSVVGERLGRQHEDHGDARNADAPRRRQAVSQEIFKVVEV